MTVTAEAFAALPAEIRDRLHAELHAIPPNTSLVVALSGGLDSMVLLHVLAHWCLAHRQALRALHIHHGLSPNADQWEQHCVAQCRLLSIPIKVVRVKVAADAGLGLEGAAREARYAAFADNLQSGEMLLLAQHQDDQAETLLLNLMRGSGVRGLAAMPRQRELAAGHLLRPLLGFSRAELETIATAWELTWVEDESNQWQHLDRNFLRHQVLQLLRQRWPSASQRLAQSAGWCGEADELLQQMAAEDLQQAQVAAGQLEITRLQQWSPSRQRNLLRYWLQQQAVGYPGEANFARILEELLPARADANPEVRWPGACLRRYRQRLQLIVGEVAEAVPQPVQNWDLREDLQLPGGHLQVRRELTTTQLLLREPHPDEPVSLRFRNGGEYCRPLPHGRRRSLKKILQEQAVPPWQRQHLPLIYYGEELAAIPGLLICRGFAATAGNIGLQVEFLKIEAPRQG